jgi:hypothetical protein
MGRLGTTEAQVVSMPGSPKAGQPTGSLWRLSDISIAFCAMPRSSKRVP